MFLEALIAVKAVVIQEASSTPEFGIQFSSEKRTGKLLTASEKTEDPAFDFLFFLFAINFHRRRVTDSKR